MKAISAGPEGIRHPGKRYMIEKEEAHALVRGGYAEYATIAPPETAVEIENPKNNQRGRKK